MEKNGLLHKVYWMYRNMRYRKVVGQWIQRGRPVPPPHKVKQLVIREYAQRHGIRVFVETGTFRGEMLDAVGDLFDRMYSIELSTELYAKAREKFRGRRDIELIQGDSGEELGKILTALREPALFWLDSHYSGGVTAKGVSETPIFTEIAHILDAQDLRHVLLIDDARLFGTNPDYPSIAELSEFIISRRKDAAITVEDDVIRVIL
ncbi:MAG TPA: hypothetical protein PLU54_07225 [Deltaproteobacteria bacterium]|nr:hypothetical protein [Deltaproteobacteria bacterium]